MRERYPLLGSEFSPVLLVFFASVRRLAAPCIGRMMAEICTVNFPRDLELSASLERSFLSYSSWGLRLPN